MKRFLHSIWGEAIYNAAHLKWNLTIESEKSTAIVGSGHFVATYRKVIFDQTQTYFEYKMGVDTELYLDEIPLKKGLWRLTTHDNYAYHMGNVFEDWIQETLEGIGGNNTSKNQTLFEISEIKNCSKIGYFIKNRLFIKFFNKKPIRKLFYKMKGLPKDEIAKY
jgi:hypothetical protein